MNREFRLMISTSQVNLEAKGVRVEVIAPVLRMTSESRCTWWRSLTVLGSTTEKRRLGIRRRGISEGILHLKLVRFEAWMIVWIISGASGNVNTILDGLDMYSKG
jgi:hypothetical protein